MYQFVTRLARAQPFWLALLVTLVYANSVANPFVFDDQVLIVDNQSIRSLWPPSWWDFRADIPLSSRPLVRLSLALNYALHELAPSGFRVVNIIAHFLVAVTLLGVLRRTFERHNRSISARGLALAATAIWLVHPLNSEVVNYLSQRSEAVMACFFLSTLYCAIRRFDGRGAGWTILATLSSVMGMASKEVMISAPLIILIYDRIFVTQSSLLQALKRHRWLYAGLFSSWFLLAALMHTGAHGDTVGFGHGVSAYSYAVNQLQIVPRYLWLSIWPHPLLLDYGYADRGLTLVETWPEFLFLGALCAFALLALRINPKIGFLALWVFLILAPSSSLVPVVSEVGAERRMYLPLMALVVMGVLLGCHILRHLRIGCKSSGVALVVVLLLGSVTVYRNRDYATAISIWQTVVTANPSNHRGQNNLGHALKLNGQVAAAVAHFEHALELQSDYADARHNLARALWDQGKIDEGEWHLRRALAANPQHAKSHYSLGSLLSSQGWSEEAVFHHSRAVDLEPREPIHRLGLGIALAAVGKVDSAVSCYHQALRLDPKLHQAHNNLGIALRQLQRPLEAVGHYRRALALKEFPDAHYNLANALVDLDEMDQGEHHYRRALVLNWGYAKAHNNLGKLLGSRGLTTAAKEHFANALAAKPDYEEAHVNLGTTYLLEDDLEAAVAHYRRAVELDPDNPMWLQNLSHALRKQVAARASRPLEAP